MQIQTRIRIGDGLVNGENPKLSVKCRAEITKAPLNRGLL